MISDERLEKALTYLATTDEQCAALRADMERCEYRAKAVKAMQFKHAAGTVADRNADAEVSGDTISAYQEYFKALQDYEAMKNKRATEAIVIDTWRSINANRRQG